MVGRESSACSRPERLMSHEPVVMLMSSQISLQLEQNHLDDQ